jgi:hypothetical protein
MNGGRNVTLLPTLPALPGAVTGAWECFKAWAGRGLDAEVGEGRSVASSPER